MGVNSLPKTVTRQRRGCDLNPGPTALTTRLPVVATTSYQEERRVSEAEAGNRMA